MSVVLSFIMWGKIFTYEIGFRIKAQYWCKILALFLHYTGISYIRLSILSAILAYLLTYAYIIHTLDVADSDMTFIHKKDWKLPFYSMFYLND